MVGSDVANDLNLAQGQTIYLKGYDELDIKIIKILDETGGRDDTFIFVPLGFSQELFDILMGLFASIKANLLMIAGIFGVLTGYVFMNLHVVWVLFQAYILR